MEQVTMPEKRRKSMNCGIAEENISELEKEGWIQEWSFHARFPDQWDGACDIVDGISKDGFWECIYVKGQTELERKDGVAYIYKRKTAQRERYEKDLGYRK